MAEIRGIQSGQPPRDNQAGGVKIATKLQGTKLASVFNAAIMSANKTEYRDISVWNKNKEGDSANIIDEAEMRVAITTIQEENKKTAPADKYTGRDDMNVENTDAEKDAFYALNDAMDYDWTSTTSKKKDKNYNQFTERKNQIEEDRRDALKAMRVMLAQVDVKALKSEDDPKPKDGKKDDPKQSFSAKIKGLFAPKEGDETKTDEFKGVRKSLTGVFGGKRIEGEPEYDDNGNAVITFKDGTSVTVDKETREVVQKDRTGKNVVATYRDTDAENETFEEVELMNDEGKTVYTKRKDGVIIKNGKEEMTESDFALDANTNIGTVEFTALPDDVKNAAKLEKGDSVKTCTKKFDGSYVVETTNGVKYYICKGASGNWIKLTYNKDNQRYE